MCGAVVPTNIFYFNRNLGGVLIPDVWGGCSNLLMTFTIVEIFGLNPRCVGRLFQLFHVLPSRRTNNSLNPRYVGRLFQLDRRLNLIMEVS